MSKTSPLIYIFGIPLLISRCLAQGGPDPLLTTISKDPDLSVFYSLFNATGGASGIPGPGLEERFNFPKIGPYTAFAPTNDAFENVPEPVVKLITAAPSYQLILAILRTHVARGSFEAEDLNNGSADVTSIEGFPLAFRLEEGGTKINGQAVLSPEEPLKAANGLVYKIDRVVDPFIGYFGEDQEAQSPIDLADATKKQSGSFDNNCSGSMASILLSDKELSTLASALQTIDPPFVKVLSLNGLGDSPIFFAPSNGAFEKAGGSGSPDSTNLAELPGSYYKTVQPSNVDFSGLLLRFGLVPEGIEDDGKAVSISGFDLAVEDGRVNNAVVEDVVCGCNGCVARISRWIDPIFRVFER
ncbi:FAS1 domain-containing protein [Phyllosticta capitalensis]|uniref:FAS1 domain-containing protein n=1 Tax=Phyllosticta capitalensis TaxID=121624 RepID=UPI003131918E